MQLLHTSLMCLVRPTCPMGSCEARCSDQCDSAPDAQGMRGYMLQLPSESPHRSRPVPDIFLHLSAFGWHSQTCNGSGCITSNRRQHRSSGKNCTYHNNGQDDRKHLKNAHPALQSPSKDRSRHNGFLTCRDLAEVRARAWLRGISAVYVTLEMGMQAMLQTVVKQKPQQLTRQRLGCALGAQHPSKTARRGSGTQS